MQTEQVNIKQANKKFHTKAILLAIASVYSMPQLVLAEKVADVLKTEKIEIISTTPLSGLGVPLNSVPSNIQTAKGADLEKQNSLGVADFIQENMTGVNVNETQNNPFQPDVSFHGFTASPLLGTPQGLSVYQDGVRINEPFGDSVNWDLIPKNAISSISLMPGSNPLFGLNTLGGALSIQTKSGDLNPGGSMQAYGGSFGRRAVEAEYGGKLDNGANYFFAGNLFKEDGWRDKSETDVLQLFAKLGWKGDKDDFNISFAGADNELNGNGYAPQTFLRNFGYESVYTQPDITKNKLGFVTGQYNHWFSDNLAFNSVGYYRNTRSSSYNPDVNNEFDAVGASSTCDGINGVAAGNNGCQGVINRGQSRQHGYGVTGQLSWSETNNLFITGLGYDHSTVKFEQTNQLFTNFSTSRGLGGNTDDTADEVNLKGRTKTWSVFATDTYNITPTVAVTASGRYNRTTVDNTDNLISSGPGSLTGHQTFDRLNPAVGITYSPVSDLNFYGGYNQGSRAPSSIEIGCSDPTVPCKLPNSLAGDPPTLKQVVAKTWEGGVRGRLSPEVKWSFGAYRTQNENDIQFIAVNTGGAGYFDNVGKTRRLGFDAALDGTLGDFSWLVGYSFIQATYESDFTAVSSSNTSADANGNIQVSKGDHLTGIPKHQLKLRGEYKVMPNWAVGANVVAFTSQYARGDENNQDANGKIAGYATLNLDTRYSFGGSGWQLFAKATNVFDHEYYSGGVIGANSFDAAGNFDPANADSNTRFLAPGAPRAGWIGLRYDFGGSNAKKTAADLN